MFSGEYDQSLDSKGRVNIPSKFRLELGETFVVAKGLENCVKIYPKAEWERFQNALRSQPSSKRRGLERFFFSGAEERSLDGQGRVLISPKMREYANLVDEIVVIGVSDTVEIWNRSAWNAYMDQPEFSAEAIAETMEALEI